MKNNYWDGAPNPEFNGFQSCHKHVSSYSISVFSLCHDMEKWQSEIQKITIKWNWCSNSLNSLVSDHFDCFYNDLHHERWTMTPCSESEVSLRRKEINGPKITQGVKLKTMLLLWNIIPKGLTNHIRNIPKKPCTQSCREVFSFCCLMENSYSKVIIDFFRKSYL